MVELSGLPRTGKTTSLEKIYNFFKKGSFKIVKSEEPAYLIKKSLSLDEIASLSRSQFNDMTLEFSRKALDDAMNLNPDIILMDRGIIDNYFWYRLLFDDKEILNDLYNKKINGLVSDMNKVDLLFVLTVEPKIAIIRDYINQLYLEPRKKTTLEKVEKMYSSYESIYNLLLESGFSEKINKINTSNINEMETGIEISDCIMTKMLMKSYKK